MRSMDELPDIPDWGKQFVDDIRHHLLQLCGQSFDTSIVEYALRRTFTLARVQVEGLSQKERDEKITKAWMLGLAEEAFTWQLLHWLSIDPSHYFELLYYAFGQIVRDCVIGLLHRAQDDPVVKECFVEAFDKIYRSLMSKAKRGEVLDYPFRGWLCKVAESACKNYLQAQRDKRHSDSLDELDQEPEDESQRPDLYVEAKERIEKVRACIEQLPEPCRTCVRYYYYDGLSLEEIATRLSLTGSQVRNYIYGLAERRLRKLWHQAYGK